ncbi:MAG: T9SS type A sorting domain-containing protein [Bacteroidales bacterium]|nr:T9SS type A sorting domain-containing protein [Bacteroidales bacterium]
MSQFAIFAGPQYTYAWSVYDQKTLHGNYFLTVNGALQTELPILPDGTMLTDSVRYIVVGIADTIHDYYGNPINVLELTSVIPYEPSFTVNGLLSLQGDLCLSSPCGETAYLSLDEGTDRHYLTLVGEMRHNYINDSIFNEGVQAQINGLEATHYDLFGAPFQTLDILELEAAVEQTLVGPVVSTGNPNIGPFPPLGMELAFYHNGIEYYFSPYIEEIYYPLGGTNYQYILLYELDNDTLIVGKEVTAQFTTSTMRIDNYLRPNYRVTLNHAEYYEHLETLHGRLAIVEEPYNTMYAIITDDDERYLIEPYFVNYAEYDELVFGEDTIAVGDSFTATGEVFRYYDDYYEYFYFNGINILEINEIDAPFLIGNEWYYEIQNENGSITYQYMYQAGDTVVQDEPTHILVKINTLYDKDFHEEITHEYVFERNGKVYWWNKTLEEFTVLYDFNAQVGDEWEIKVGNESLVMHVDAVETIEYEGRTYRMLHVSDPDDLFSGDIVCGIGHLTSFFPERLIDNGDGIRVEGLRCYWVEDELVFKYGDEDCDAIYEELHGLDEDGPSTLSEGLVVYPNPTNGVLFVETHGRASLSNQTYRISNLMGQTVLLGNITAETQQIDVSGLPKGMYFISIGSETRKFVVRR